MGDILGDAKISNTFWVLEFPNIFFFFLWGGGGEMNGKSWARAYV